VASWLFTKTSTDEGTVAVPPAVNKGVVTKSGRNVKSWLQRTPAKRTELPHAPGSLIASPTLSVSNRSGNSRV